MREAIKLAIEGGYTFFGFLTNKGLGDGVWEMGEPDEVIVRRKEVIIDYVEIIKYELPVTMVREDPLFWQCLGKSLGWLPKKGQAGEAETGKGEHWGYVYAWDYYWHRFIDHLAEGKDVEEFFNQLKSK